jgi:hypothetical protein
MQIPPLYANSAQAMQDAGDAAQEQEPRAKSQEPRPKGRQKKNPGKTTYICASSQKKARTYFLFCFCSVFWHSFGAFLGKGVRKHEKKN